MDGGARGKSLRAMHISAILITFLPHCVLPVGREYHLSLREAFSMICFFLPRGYFFDEHAHAGHGHVFSPRLASSDFSANWCFVVQFIDDKPDFG